MKVWYLNYKAKHHLILERQIEHYQAVVEKYHHLVFRAFLLGLLGVLFAITFFTKVVWMNQYPPAQVVSYTIFGLDPNIVYKTVCQLLGTLSALCALYGVWVAAKAKKVKPREKVIKLSRDFSKTFSMAVETTLWDEYLHLKVDQEGFDVYQERLRELNFMNQDERKLPDFLVEFAKSRLSRMGKEIRSLEDFEGRGNEARALRNGEFKRCFDHAKAFGVIDEDAGYDLFIPKSSM